MDYKEYKEAEQKRFDALPIFYAFSNEQFADALAERGLKVEEAKANVYRFGNGGFYLKKDADKIRAYVKSDPLKTLRNLIETDLEFAKDAFEYEMYNHEYPINWQGDWDVVSCFGYVEYGEEKTGADYLRELGFGEAIVAAYIQIANKVNANSNY